MRRALIAYCEEQEIAKGMIFVSTADGILIPLRPNTDGQVLRLDSTREHGAYWSDGGGTPAMMGFSNARNSVAPLSVEYMSVMGGAFGNATEAPSEYYMPFPCTLRNARFYAGSNASVGNTVVTLRLNGADTAIAVTYATTETGLKSDLTNAVAIAAGDRVTLKIDAQGATGLFTFDSFSIGVTS